jgi:hypothetical protein
MSAEIYQEDWTSIGSYGLRYRCTGHRVYKNFVYVQIDRWTPYGLRAVADLEVEESTLRKYLFKRVYDWEKAQEEEGY